MLGGGGGLGASAMFGLGGYYGGLLSPEAGAMLATALPTAGYGLKSTGNLLTQRALQKSNKKVRQRSPLYENAPLDRDALSSRYGLLRMLMSGDNSEN